MRRDSAPHAQMIRAGMPAFPEPNQRKNKKRRPPNKKRAHEPVTKLKDVIDLISVRGCVRRLPQKLVDQRQATHICSNLPRLSPDMARRACAHAAKDGNRMLRSQPEPTSQRQKETRSRRPCVRLIFHPSRHSKTDTPAPVPLAKR